MNETQEIWKKVKSYDLEVSNMGNVRKSSSQKKIKINLLNLKNKKVPTVSVLKNGVLKSFYLPTLVYRTFLGKIPKSMQIRHSNGNNLDNCVSNLSLEHMGISRHNTRCEKKVKILNRYLNYKKKYTMCELSKITNLSAISIRNYIKKGSIVFDAIGYPNSIIDFSVEVIPKSSNRGRKSILSDDVMVEIIKEYWMNYKVPGICTQLARKYKVPTATIQKSIKGKAYKHIKVTPIFDKV